MTKDLNNSCGFSVANWPSKSREPTRGVEGGRRPRQLKGTERAWTLNSKAVTCNLRLVCRRAHKALIKIVHVQVGVYVRRLISN